MPLPMRRFAPWLLAVALVFTGAASNFGPAGGPQSHQTTFTVPGSLTLPSDVSLIYVSGCGAGGPGAGGQGSA